jgi:DNA primase
MAGRIPQSFIDDLVGRADIVEVVGERVALKKSGREFSACCPFHDEKTPSFTVSPQKQFYHCFGCGAHGTVLGFLMQYEHVDFVQAVEDLAARYGLDVPREGGGGDPDDASRARAQAALDALERAAALYRRWLKSHPESDAAKSYLRGRGLSGRTAADFELGYAPPGWDNLLGALTRELAPSAGGEAPARETLARAGLLAESEDGRRRYDRFRNRIMFPIRDRRGRVVGFGARTLGDDTPKYLNSPETALFHKGRELYGLHRVQRRRQRAQIVVVVEGYMDVVMLAEHGVDYACATLGTAATPEQMEQLFRVCPDAVFCFDGDAAGRRAAWRALENALPQMRDGRSARFVFLPEGEDPDSFVRARGRAAFEALLADAPTASTFLFEQLRERVDTGTPEGRARLTEEARPLIERMPEGVLRTLATQRLSELIGLPLERTEGELGLRPATAGARAPGPAPAAPGVATPARRAVSLLLHHPRLAATAGEVTDLAELDTPGADLLSELVSVLKARPQLSTAGIVEHFRDHPRARALARLAAADAPPDGNGLEAELADCLERLRLEPGERRFQRLRQRVLEGGATPEEQREYASLAQGRTRGASGR